MENHFFSNGLHFEPSPPSSSMPTWHSLSSSSAMEIQSFLLNCSSNQNQDCFYNNPDYGFQFDSALSSMVSSPAASDHNNMPNENVVISELVGKLGTSYMNGNNNNSSNTFFHSTPLRENLNSSVAEFSTDRGFIARAAKFSCFGRRSFKGRSSQLVVNNAESLAQRSAQVMENEKLPRVSSSPSLKTLLGSQMVTLENKNSPFLDRMDVANSQEESTISEQNPNGETGAKPSPDMNSRKRKASTRGKAKETSITNKGVEGTEDSNAKRSKSSEGEGSENGTVKIEEETKGDTSNPKPPDPPKDYIHVRARRGQATDSHSLAERVRREKISERMKLLQDIVPGCNKVTGKALMLDEIINYVQSLQHQVEFLSMKLSSINTKMDFSSGSLISKDIFQSNNSSAHPIFQLDSSPQASYGHQTQQDPAIQYNIPNGTMTHSSVDSLDTTALCQINLFNEGSSQYPLTFREDDLNTIVQMGFGQIANRKTPVQVPSFNGSSRVPQMKLEL